MKNCLKCDKSYETCLTRDKPHQADCPKRDSFDGYDFHVLEVQTLHIRDFGGEKRVQALGLFQDYFICPDCAREKLADTLAPGKALWKRCAAFALLLVLGVVLAIFLWSDGAIRLFGLAACACGIMGLFSTISTGKKRRTEFEALDRQDALARAAWDCLTAAAPKKDGENDLTYIPVDEKTLALDPRALALAYDLLPAVAAKAYKLLRGGE